MISESIDWLDPEQRRQFEEELKERFGTALWQRNVRKFTIYGPFFRDLKKAIENGRIRQDKAAQIIGCDISTVSRWCSEERAPNLFELDELEITQGRLHLLGESLRRNFVVDGHNYTWNKASPDIFTGYFYPQLVQIAGVLPTIGESYKTSLSVKREWLLFDTTLAVKPPFLRAAENAGFLKMQDSGNYTVIPAQSGEEAYFQGIFDRHGYAGLQRNSLSLLLMAGKGWRDLLGILASPAIVTKLDYYRKEETSLTGKEKEGFEKLFAVREFPIGPVYREHNDYSRFWLAPTYLNRWLERQRALGEEPDPNAIAEHLIHIGRAACHSYSPKKANGVADCIEKVAHDYGESANLPERNFRRSVRASLIEHGAFDVVEEIRGRFPRIASGYSIFIYPRGIEEAGISQGNCQKYIGELARGSQLSISPSYPQDELIAVLSSGVVPFGFRV